METQCSGEQPGFHPLGRRSVSGRFDGGRGSSDAGGVLPREADKRTGVTARVSRCFVDHRNPAWGDMRRLLAWALLMAVFLSGIGGASERPEKSSRAEREACIRQRVGRSNASFVSPDPAVVKVLLMTPGAVAECSGAVISRNKVLTAAHCLIDAKGQWMPGQLVVIPGLDGWRHEPWGRFEVTQAVEEGFDYRTARNDIAVLSVGRNVRGESIGDITGWFQRSPSRFGQDVQGYAGLLAEQQHEMCSTVEYFESEVEHDCFVPKGTSGSPLFHVDEATGETWIVAVNSRTENGRAIATRLRGAMWDFVEAEVRDDP